MTDRIPLDLLTSDQYDQLCNELVDLRQLATMVEQSLAIARLDLDRAKAELAALRAVARGYCPACGRGDAAPSVTDWERERQRAEAAEAKVADYENRITWHTTCEACARVLDSAIQETERRERVEAALARVRGIASELFMGGRTQIEREIGRRLSAALDRGQP